MQLIGKSQSMVPLTDKVARQNPATCSENGTMGHIWKVGLVNAMPSVSPQHLTFVKVQVFTSRVFVNFSKKGWTHLGSLACSRTLGCNLNICDSRLNLKYLGGIPYLKNFGESFFPLSFENNFSLNEFSSCGFHQYGVHLVINVVSVSQH